MCSVPSSVLDRGWEGGKPQVWDPGDWLSISAPSTHAQAKLPRELCQRTADVASHGSQPQNGGLRHGQWWHHKRLVLLNARDVQLPLRPATGCRSGMPSWSFINITITFNRSATGSWADTGLIEWGCKLRWMDTYNFFTRQTCMIWYGKPMTSYVYVCFTVRFHASDRSGDNMSQAATLVPVSEDGFVLFRRSVLMTRVLLDNWGRDVFILWKVPSNFHGEAGTTRMSSTVCDDIDELVVCCRGVFIHALGWIIPAWLIQPHMFQSTRHEPGCARATNHMASRNFTCPGYRHEDREVSTGSKRSMRNPSSYQQLI